MQLQKIFYDNRNSNILNIKYIIQCSLKQNLLNIIQLIFIPQVSKSKTVKINDQEV